MCSCWMDWGKCLVLWWLTQLPRPCVAGNCFVTSGRASCGPPGRVGKREEGRLEFGCPFLSFRLGELSLAVTTAIVSSFHFAPLLAAHVELLRAHFSFSEQHRTMSVLCSVVQLVLAPLKS